MMTGTLLLAAVWVARPAAGFVSRRCCPSNTDSARRLLPEMKSTIRTDSRLFSSKDSDSRAVKVAKVIDQHVSRLSTFQALLRMCGAPGSIGCTEAGGDLVPVQVISEMRSEDTGSTTPELVASLYDDRPARLSRDEVGGLHPYLYPISKSSRSGNFICAYYNPSLDASSPWPIVETATSAPGMRLLALNSEHLMRRIAATVDSSTTHEEHSSTSAGNDKVQRMEALRLYNRDLGKGLLKDSGLDAPYVPGSVDKLGYGLEKYALIRIGPFLDLYQNLSAQHVGKGDVQAALIAAEACIAKLPGFASTFLSYARLLQSLPNREEEARDAARNCLRMPLWTVGISRDEVKEAAVLGQLSTDRDSFESALQKLADLYDKIQLAEADSGKSAAVGDAGTASSPEQVAVDECQDLLNRAILQQKPWNNVRSQIIHKFRKAGAIDMADFLEEVSSSSVSTSATTDSVLQ